VPHSINYLPEEYMQHDRGLHILCHSSRKNDEC
jgi:hypothetical protein